MGRNGKSRLLLGISLISRPRCCCFCFCFFFASGLGMRVGGNWPEEVILGTRLQHTIFPLTLPALSWALRQLSAPAKWSFSRPPSGNSGPGGGQGRVEAGYALKPSLQQYTTYTVCHGGYRNYIISYILYWSFLAQHIYILRMHTVSTVYGGNM